MLKPRLFTVAALLVCLSACDSAEDRKLKYFTQGQDFVGADNLDKAKISLKNALKIDPNHLASHLLFAQIKRDDNDLRGALGHYNKVLELDANHLEALLESAEILLLGGQKELALTRANQAFALAGDNADVLSLKASLAFAMQDRSLAKRFIKQALAIDAMHIDANLGLANIMALEHDYRGSIDALQASLAVHKNELKLWLMLAKVQNAMGDNKAALLSLKTIQSLDKANLAFFNTLVDYQLKHFSVPQALTTVSGFIAANPDSIDAKLLHIRLLNQDNHAAALAQLDDYIAQSSEQYRLSFAKAEMLLSDKDYLAVEAIYQGVIEQEGEQNYGLQARSLLAQAKLQQQQVEPAKQLLQAVLEINANDAQALLLRGKLALHEKDVISAIADFRGVLRDDPNNIELLSLLSKAHLLNNEPQLATDQLRRIIAKQPKHIQSRMQLSDLLLRQGQVEAALEQTVQALQVAPGDVRVQLENIKILLALKRYPESEAKANNLIANEDTAALGLYFLGLSKQAQAQHKDAITLFKKSLQSRPKAVEPVPVLIKSYLALKQTQTAKAWLAKHIKQQPKKAVSYNILGELAMADKDYPLAINAFENAIKLSPKQWLTYRNLAVTYRARNDIEAAIAALKQGLDVVDNKTRLRLELAAYYESQGQFESAIGEYSALYHDGNKSDLVVNNLAMLLMSYKQQDQAALDLAKQLAQQLKNSDNPLLLDTAGWVYYQRQELDLALPIIKRAASQAKQNAGIQYHLGMTYFALNQTALAKQHLQQALDTGKAFVGAKQAKATLAELQKRS